MESDWKKFRAMAPVLRERYLAERHAGILRKFTDPKKTETERFWDTLEEMEAEAKILRHCLDGHSRSKMWLYMLSMAHAGMLKSEDMVGFSDELREQMAQAFEKREARDR
jgi:predicted protein tyrosine phosphatase